MIQNFAAGRNRRSSPPISRRCCCYYWRWISMNKQLIITTMVLALFLEKKNLFWATISPPHHHKLLLHLHRLRPQVKILSFFHTKELQLGSLVSCVSLLCRDLVSVHIIYEYEWYLLPPPSSWHQRTGKTTRDYHYSNEYSILTRRPTRNIQLSDSSSSLSLSLFLSLQKLRRNFRIFIKKTSAGALTMSVKTLGSCMQRKKKRKRMSATPVSPRSYTPRIDARTSMEHLLRRPSPGRRWPP